MKLNFFSTPIWIGNIDTNYIKIERKEIRKSFESEIKTTYSGDGKDSITTDSVEFLLHNIVRILDKEILNPYRLELLNIWENIYHENDFQENHIHVNSDLSFIIYKKIDKSRTVFFNPANKLIECFYGACRTKSKLFGELSVEPECRENQIIIFPSFIEHMVKKTSNAQTIAGNIKLIFEGVEND